MFGENLSSYRIVDLSKTVTQENATEIRPLQLTKEILHDLTYGFRVVTHTHTGTHVEAPSHFYDGGKDIDELPCESFLGRAVLLETEGGEYITREMMEERIGDIMSEGSIIIARNNSAQNGPSRISLEATKWMVEHGVKLFGFDFDIKFGLSLEEGRAMHDEFLSRDIPLVEWLTNLGELTKREFFFISLPFKAKMDSSWTRAIAIE